MPGNQIFKKNVVTYLSLTKFEENISNLYISNKFIVKIYSMIISNDSNYVT